MKPDDAVDCVLTINGEDHPITVSISPRTSATYRPNKAFDANGVLCREEDHPTLPPVLYMDGKGWINGRDDIVADPYLTGILQMRRDDVARHALRMRRYEARQEHVREARDALRGIRSEIEELAEIRPGEDSAERQERVNRLEVLFHDGALLTEALRVKREEADRLWPDPRTEEEE